MAPNSKLSVQSGSENSILARSPLFEVALAADNTPEMQCLAVQGIALIHGGAWDIPGELKLLHKEGLEPSFQRIISLLSETLEKNGKQLRDEALAKNRREILDIDNLQTYLQELGSNAVCSAVAELENNPVYDAGFGSFLNEHGEVELDAGLMCGDRLLTGAVAALGAFANPIFVAQAVAQRTAHVLLVGEGANAFASSQGFSRLTPDALVHPREIEAHRLWLQQGKPDARTYFATKNSGSYAGSFPEKRGTVGATLALRFVERQRDQHHQNQHHQNQHRRDQLELQQPSVTPLTEWQLFAGTSTGGTPGKLQGRVGDVPVPGAGFYADNEGAAVSATGWGEGFLRTLPCKRVNDLCVMGMHPQDACETALREVFRKTGGRGGLIAISAQGLLGCAFSTPDMAVRATRVEFMHL